MMFLPLLAPIAGGIAAGVGSAMESNAAQQMNAQQLEWAKQQHFDQMYRHDRLVRTRVSDARQAGIHPLVALGASLSHPPGTAVGGFSNPGSPVGSALRDMGQNLSRAASALMPQSQKVNSTLQTLQLERAGLENELLRAQIAQARAGTGPGLPASAELGSLTASGQGNAYVLEKPAEKVIGAPGHPNQDPGYVADLGWAKTKTGLVPVPSKDVKERIEDQFIPETMWAVRNQLLPNFSPAADKPPRHLLPKWADDWHWSYTRQEWQPAQMGPQLPAFIRNVREFDNYIKR